MQYRALGRTGLQLSAVGVGTWQLSGEWGVDFAQADVDAILDAAGDAGVNFIDTAECYGDHRAEALIGDYLSRRDRSRWIIATKFGHHFDGFMSRRDDFSVDGVRRQLDASLAALRIDAIDLYQFHSGPDAAFNNDQLWEMLHAERQAGKIRQLGVSLNKSTERQADWAAARGVAAMQVVYNRIDQRAATVHFPYARRDGLGVIARVPLASGLLSGKYGRGAEFPANDTRSRRPPAELKRELTEVERVRAREVPPGVPMAQWAIAWCLRDPLVSTVIPGCKSALQMRNNAAAADLAGVD